MTLKMGIAKMCIVVKCNRCVFVFAWITLLANSFILIHQARF